ncbi:MAG: N-6 DNA methylase [Planctomycetia bacterium]|nr:N-6 DNA methylase [Planctomycetia bacterium]
MITKIAQNIIEKIRAVQPNFINEEDVRINCETIFTEELSKIDIAYRANYEVQVKSGIIDALFNNLFIEYKKPNILRKNFSQFVSEKSKYFSALATKYGTEEDKIYGILLDGFQIGFFRKTSNGELLSDGPYDLSDKTLSRFIQIANATKYKALTSDNLLHDLGTHSTITKKLLRALWKALKKRKNPRTNMFLKEWSRLFGQVSDFRNGGTTVIKEAEKYGISITAEECGTFIFSLHTLYAIYIKHLALRILQAKRRGCYAIAEEIYAGKSLLEISRTIENESEFQNLGILNFLEGDFFCWYISEWNQEIEVAIHQLIIDTLDKYEPSTGTLKPEIVRDLLKELYQGLMSKEIRHDLGEYYTPDWLAHYTIRKSGYQVQDRILDPTCGSGTFLVLLINQTIAILKNTHSAQKLVDYITSHIYGMDLNPLAVLTARTNYLITLEAYLEDVEHLELPVYLCDAIFSPQKNGDYYTYFIDTEDGRLSLKLPLKVFEKNILAKVLNDIEYCVRISTSSDNHLVTENEVEQKLRVWKKYGLSDDDIECLFSLYQAILHLERKEWNGIWCRIIKNHFTSAQLKDFDIIIGNPPWLKWSVLPPAYRQTIKEFCRDYDLFSSDKFYGGIESDVSTIVLYSVAEKWLRFNGTLAMLITRSVFKTKSAEGFRKFRIPSDHHIQFEVQEVHDFTPLKPFQEATNKPTLLLMKKNLQGTHYPLDWIVWDKKNNYRIMNSMPLEEIIQKTQRIPKVAAPVGAYGSPWLTVPSSELSLCKILAKKEGEPKNYYARKGICTDCNGVYYGNVLTQKKQFCVFRNNPSLGRKNLPQMESHIEKEIVFPIARGKEIKAFQWNFGGTYGILPQNSMHGFSMEKMLLEYPEALKFFSKFQDILLKRGSLIRYLPNDPFYTCWNVGMYTFAKYKVCWAEISGQFKSCILSEQNGNIVIPDHKIYFIPTNNKREAEYLCAFLNAPAVEQFVLGYVETTQIGTHITDYIKIPKFDYLNANHLRLADITNHVICKKISLEKAREEIDSLLSTIII